MEIKKKKKSNEKEKMVCKRRKERWKREKNTKKADLKEIEFINGK